MKPQGKQQTVDHFVLEPRFLVLYNMTKMVRKNESRKHRMESRKEGIEIMQINIMINITYSLYHTSVSGMINNTQEYCHVHITKKRWWVIEPQKKMSQIESITMGLHWNYVTEYEISIVR